MSPSTSRTLVLAAIVALAAAPATASAADLGPAVRSAGDLRDLQLGSAGPFDAARASFQLVESRRGSHAVLRVQGIGSAADGSTYGAHLHLGPCVAGNGDAALGHYNDDRIRQRPTVRVTEETEVWLDLTVADGAATSTASVPFVPLPGDRSVVIHAVETDHETGLAGARLACLPVEW